MKIAVVGGTGKEGRGMALRWAKAGHSVFIGSREAERAASKAQELRAGGAGAIEGGDNAWAVQQAEVVVLSVPYGAHTQTIESLKSDLAGRIIIDITVPLVPPEVRTVHLPKGQSAALETRAILGMSARVVAALHHVSSTHLGDPDHDIDCDVLACGDDDAAVETALGVIRDLGVRAFHAGPLANAVALESLTPVLLHLTKKYRGAGVGIRLTGV
ncbi:MAG TPA: NADPH-dependent F420 reductase [Polyangiales bacterium]